MEVESRENSAREAMMPGVMLGCPGSWAGCPQSSSCLPSLFMARASQSLRQLLRPAPPSHWERLKELGATFSSKGQSAQAVE